MIIACAVGKIKLKHKWTEQGIKLFVYNFLVNITNMALVIIILSDWSGADG